MKFINYSPTRLKIFFLLLFFFNSPILIVYPFFKSVAFWPVYIWINLPGIPLHYLGVPFYQKNSNPNAGVFPIGVLGWGLNELFYVIIALLISYAINRKGTS
jgi:hypothetical protein